MKKFFLGVVCFAIGAAGVWLGAQYYFKTGLFKTPGELVFSDQILDSEAEKYRGAVGEIELNKNVVFSEFYSMEPSDALLIDAIVPVTDFYDANNSITQKEFDARFASGKGVVSIFELDENQKLLAIDEKYYLENFDSGAQFKYLRIEGEDEADVEKVKELIKPVLLEMPTKEAVLTFTQTGVTALSRNMNTKMNEVDSGAFFAENIANYLKKFDLTHTSNESSFSDWASSYNICSDWRFVDTLTAIGLDVVELTGNHNVDCGDDDAIATLDKYKELGIKTVGGGRGATEAEVPLQIEQKGSRITMLAYNQSTGGATWDETPGANQYYAENAETRIAEAKKRGDTVIVDVQFNECNAYASTYEDPTCDYADSAPGDQVGLFRSLIDMGADIVVGTSAHQTQTFEQYNGGEIYYGLGNLFFDQIWWPGTTRSLGLTHYFWNNKLIQTRRFGTVYGDTYQTRVMTDEEEQWFINRLNQAR